MSCRGGVVRGVPPVVVVVIVVVLILVTVLQLVSCNNDYVSAVGDPGMARDGLRLAIESWNQCNEVGEEAPNMGSPRAADCFDIFKDTDKPQASPKQGQGQSPHRLVHRVTEKDNRLGVGQRLNNAAAIQEKKTPNAVDLYAAQKELYLGHKCQVQDTPKPWQFWMIMLKSGNMDTRANRCPKNGFKFTPYGPDRKFPCFGKGCMNQPLIYHNFTTLQGPNNTLLKGRFFGSWDLDADLTKGLQETNASYHSVTWEKELGQGSWTFHHVLRTSLKYPWLMLYLRADATDGFSGGYHYPTRGMLKIIPESPDFKVRFMLDVIKGGGPNSQFYLLDIGSCWKNTGMPCNGDVTSDVTRYSEMVLNPDTPSWCHPDNFKLCPPYHTFPNGSRVHRSNTARFPYEAYHMYCAPGNAIFAEKPNSMCDPYSNPQPQEILQILPHPVWGDYGYPTEKGEGWIGDPKSWDLHVGRLSESLYFYQDPGTPPARRQWTSIDLGTEIYMGRPDQVAEWTVSNFDILVPKKGTTAA
ncbi:uncharacterized protein LOC127253306 [Andrographis paniculata]|uniref:uncharacterized protein LOC127253306 n=1 Tax=Andrographis paniculata TaxID=175694 RepID=UPI0021E96755|nr:uncharacterized protein LOC127253306 [Andrographis paniculata]